MATLIAIIAAVVFLWRWFGKNRATVVASLDERFERASSTPRMTAMHSTNPTAWTLRTGKFAQSGYLAFHLLIGFIVSLAVIGIFASITEGLVDSSPLTRFDVVVAERLRESAAPAALRTFEFVSRLGGRGAMTLLLFGGGFVYALRRKGLELTGWCAAFIGGSLLDPRCALSCGAPSYRSPTSSFSTGAGLASGHLLGVLVGYGMLAYFVCSFIRNAAARH